MRVSRTASNPIRMRTTFLLVLMLIVPYCWSLISIATTTVSYKNKELVVIPSRVEFKNVFLQYPQTLARRLFSSVPYREWALRNVSFTLESSELLILTGASSSGKSTILKLISGKAIPTQGSVNVACADCSPPIVCALPVYLDRKPPVENMRTVQTCLVNTCSMNTTLDASVTALIAEDLMQRVGLANCNEKTPSQLSPSEQYRLELVKASLESMLPGTKTKCSSCDVDDAIVQLPAPIILLDEWLDKETSSVVQKVQVALEALLELGAVICSVTHKPERWNTEKSNSSIRHMTMCRGEILSFQQQRE